MSTINSELSDEELVKAIRLDDTDAFKKLYYRYFSALIRFAASRTRSIDSSKEFVQELFSRIWMKRSYLDPSKSVKSYLYKSLTNLIINSSKLHSSHTISTENIRDSGSYKDQQDLELLIDMNRALDRMPEKLKMVYLLSKLEGFKYAEIAEICNISIKAVEKRMNKAFNYLTKELS